MNNREVAGDVGRYLVARIVSSYVRHNRVAANELQTMIAFVHQSLSSLGNAPTPTAALTPAVPIRRSVRREYVVCLECGFRGLTLRRHLRVQHGLDPAAYYARWKLPSEYPITAPAYSARRSALAKELGLGRPARSAPRRRSRSRARKSLAE